MATIDESIEAELESKSIEKEPSLSLEINEEDQGLSIPVKKSKKVRSKQERKELKIMKNENY